MTWSVRWVPYAENQLAALWLNTPDRKTITEAANRIDRFLAVDPDRIGVPYQKRRMLFQAPLAVTYAVVANQWLVEVLEVERISQ